MKKLRNTILAIILLSTGFIFPAVAQQTFIINGRLNEQVTGKIYLIYKKDGQSAIDSSVVNNGKFQLTGNLGDPVFATLSLNPEWQLGRQGIKHNDFQNFFLEATTTTVTGTGTLSAAIINGGKAQRDYQEQGRPLLSLNDEMKKLTEKATQYKNEGNDAELKNIMDKMEALRVRVDQSDSVFIITHPDSYVAFTLWKNKHRGVVDPELETEYSRFSKGVKNTAEGRKMYARIMSAKRLSPGKTAPEINLPQPDGKMVALSSLRGKNVLLCFWFQRFISFNDFAFNLTRVQRQLKDKNLVIMAVYYDMVPGENRELWLQMIREKEFNWVNVADLGGISPEQGAVSSVAKTYELSQSTMPQAFLIGPDGKIVARHLPLRDRDLYIDVEKLLK